MAEWAVALQDVYRTYQAGPLAVPALRGITVQIAPAEFLAIAGPSGSGKTTLLNIIGGLDRADAGEVRVAGQNLHALPRGQLARLRLQHIGFVFQAYNLIPVLTAGENAEFTLLLQGVPEPQRRERLSKLFVEMGLAGLEERRPAELSGGQQQRVAVARAVATEPALILADEPTANLDSTSSADVLDLLGELNGEGRTIVIITHERDIAARAERIIQMRDGEIEPDARDAAA